MSKASWSQSFTLSFVVLLLCLASQVSAVQTWYTPTPSDGMDTWFGDTYNKGGMPTDYRLRIGGWGDQYNGLIRFNLSGLPQVATTVVLWMYTFPDSGTPVDYNWYRVVHQWQEGTVGWNNQPWDSLFLWWRYAPPVGYSGWYGRYITDVYNAWRRGDSNYLNFGLKFTPLGTNNQFTQFYSSDYMSNPGLRPTLYVESAATESKITLKWPLATSYGSRQVNQAFGVNWSTGKTCNGLIEKHNGTDYAATAGTAVYAPEDGWVKDVHYDSSGLYAYNIVIEHNHPLGTFTTVSWHVNPLVAIGDFVPKGMQIATVANLGSITHYHFGIRIGAYTTNVSGTGALPQTICGGYPAFPADFIDPDNTNSVLFQ